MTVVDLRSDTVTRPSAAMKQAMFEAELGDDVLGDDPTVKRLQEMAVEVSGKEAALFVPSGTMANQIAIGLHCRPGSQMLMYAGGHPFNYESGGAAANSGVQTRTLAADHGILDPNDVLAAIPVENEHFAPVDLIIVEDTSNRGGGTVYPLERIDQICALAHENGARVHMDGARVFNAVVQSGVSLARRAREVDTVTFCLSKGLGCPVGSVLCGAADDIHRAKWIRKRLGGGMRQAGLLAAAGIFALEYNVERLADDHALAKNLWAALSVAGFQVKEPMTNMVYVRVPDGPGYQAALEERGVRCFATAPDTLRLVVHMDVPPDAAEQVVTAFIAVRNDRIS